MFKLDNSVRIASGLKYQYATDKHFFNYLVSEKSNNPLSQVIE